MLRRFKHGEVVGHELTELPVNLVKVDIKENFIVVGESETHGNDHRVAVLDKENVEFYRDQFEKLYMKNSVETNIYCPNQTRHDTCTLPPGIWEIGKSQEYDYETQELRAVRD